jgi:endonuclease-3 related protein
MSVPRHVGPKASGNDPASLGQRLLEVYRALYDHNGPQHWWPAETPFEVIIGAILTQSAAWLNVEKAIVNLKRAAVLTPASLRSIPTEDLARLIYPSGYYNAKAGKIRAFVERLGEAHGDSLDHLFSLDTDSLRDELLAIHGIGPETADSIILYAAEKPVFVIDAYTRRILSRLGLSPPEDDYEALQRLFMENLPPEARLFNEYHALLVRHGKDVCKKTPRCNPCCLADLCLYQRRRGQLPA